ncbi:MAG: hypothetical protein H7Y03_00075 [Chitinophagaceae bacterium]|nr:hypothetical protein [Chitinophagaceae bacterium]
MDTTPHQPEQKAQFFSRKPVRISLFAGFAIALAVLSFVLISRSSSGESTQGLNETDTSGILPSAADSAADVAASATLDTALYDNLSTYITNKDSSGRWPVKGPYPLPGAILPFKRVISFYGNLYSKKMGILGELPRNQMLEKLQAEVAQWQAADSTIEAIPALHYIAITAQGSPGKGSKYRLRMPFHQIDSVLSMAGEINALVFIDIQVGLSTLQEELPAFEKYLLMPNVHFGIDPEFSMKTGARPGSVIGTFDAADINYTTEYLAKLVKENNLPPKMLVIHRFTRPMVTNYKQIELHPEVQIIIDMDGWGHQARKMNTYKQFVEREPVQFTGFKLFYKNDLKEANSHVMTPTEVLSLTPQPAYIQYQ